jgi:hypothetical protein
VEISVVSSEETDDEQPPSLEETKHEFGEMKNNKVPGINGLLSEMFKYG